MTTNIYGKFYFIECDEIVTRALAPFMQFCANSPSSTVEKICIDSATSIDNFVSYRCLENDLDLKKSVFEARKYSLTYPHLKISFSRELPSSMSEEYIISRFDGNKNYYRYNKDNYFLITCSSTPQNIIDDIKSIVSNSNANNYTHIHCEIGNLEDGGMFFCSNGKTSSETAISYPQSIPNLKKGDTNSLKMLVQSVMGANILFSILINRISFGFLRSRPLFFNYSKMDIDVSPHAPKLMEPIKLLGKKKVIKKKGKKKRKKTIDDRFYILFIGSGAVTSNSLDSILQLANLEHQKVAKIAIMDGDTSERKNLLNQRFLPFEIGDFKVNSLVKRYSKTFSNLESKIKAIPEFLYELNEELLLNIFEIDSLKDKNVIIVGGVDNNPTRKKVDEGFSKINKIKNFIYIDSGNGSTERIGQTITGYKQYGKVILQPIAGSGIDNGLIRSNTEDINVVGSCSRTIQEHPQHQSTSVGAACSLIANFANVFIDKTIKNHASFFDVENIYLNSN